MRHIGYSSPRCPQDAAHGPLMAWPSSVAGWYCPHQAHEGNPFYTTGLELAIRSPGESVIPARTAGTSVVGALTEASDLSLGL